MIFSHIFTGFGNFNKISPKISPKFHLGILEFLDKIS